MSLYSGNLSGHVMSVVKIKSLCVDWINICLYMSFWLLLPGGEQRALSCRFHSTGWHLFLQFEFGAFASDGQTPLLCFHSFLMSRTWGGVGPAAASRFTWAPASGLVRWWTDDDDDGGRTVSNLTQVYCYQWERSIACLNVEYHNVKYFSRSIFYFIWMFI